MPDTHPNLERNLGEIRSSVQELQNWRLLVVDPALKEHGDKIEGFERIEMQITGALKFLKGAAACAGASVVFFELARFIAVFLRK